MSDFSVNFIIDLPFSFTHSSDTFDMVFNINHGIVVPLCIKSSDTPLSWYYPFNLSLIIMQSHEIPETTFPFLVGFDKSCGIV